MIRFFTSIILFALTITLYTSIYPNIVRAEETPSKTANERSAAPIEPQDEIVARVNDFEITYYYHQLAISSLMPKMAYHKVTSEKRLDEISKTALENLIKGQLFYEEALKRNISTTKREVQKRVKKFHNNLPKGTTLRKILKQSNMTRKDLEEEFRRAILIEAVRAEINEEIQEAVKEVVTEAFIRDHYDNNQELFIEPDKTHISEILLRADPGGGKRHWLEIRENAKAIEARIRGGEEFSEVAKEVSQDPYASNGGNMGWMHTGTLDPALEQAVNKLQPGELSEPVESLYGYHIIKLHERNPRKLKPYEDLNHENLKARLDKIETRRIKKERTNSLRDKADIEYY